MINKLQKKIFWILMVSMSIIFIGSIIIFSIISYNSIIDSSVFMLDRLANGRDKSFFQEPKNEFEDFYRINFENNQYILQSDNVPEEKLFNEFKKTILSGREKGIVKGYVYVIHKSPPNQPNSTNAIFMKSEMIDSQINKIKINNSLLSLFLLILIYVVSRKVSKVLVEPINNTFEKQKQFISDASHELKTPLAIIKANADVIESKLDGNNKWIAYIQNEIESMNKLINELLLLAKIENIDDIKEYQNLNVSNELKEIYSMFESMAQDKGVTLENKILNDVILNCNKQDIEHIASTLLDNAICHTEKNNKVILELNTDKTHLNILVKNQGEKIPDEEKEKIFERFYRVDKSRNRNSKRYGLGLAICKGTVLKYNGTIDLSYKNGFTIFKVSIPLAKSKTGHQ